ncbi:hypothetical protein BVC80_4015g2 [Macleaya cordata]|uniref:Endonuclease/exonuclease/phosphatase n=1 Tax=Macleaya cordata TaxID=56857 RepID=A0A200PTL7_MACCD|nr:hypothetical protein BVC80_4015g2 [Macleaya cordata]
MGDQMDAPWVILADLNTILEPSKKLGGRKMLDADDLFIKSVLNDIGLTDLGFKGPPFTWSNHRQGLAHIQVRLDRAMANND